MEKVTGTLKPDTIAVLQGGIVGGRSATYEDRDAFGTLGGRARVEAAALLAKQFPQAVVLTTDAVNASELEALGVAPGRIVFAGPDGNNTFAALKTIAAHAHGTVGIVSSEYHLPRVRAFCALIAFGRVEYISAEAVLAAADPAFQKTFDEVKKTPAYKLRLESEARGIEAIKRGNYNSAPPQDKQERTV